MPKTTLPSRNGHARPKLAKPAGDPAADLRFWAIMLFCGAGLMLVLLTAAIVVIRNASSHEPEEAELPQPQPMVLETKPTPTIDLAPKKRDTPTMPAIVAKPRLEEKTIPTGLSPQDTQKMDLLLETTGSLSALHLYQCHLNLGLLADAVEKETYTKADAQRILGTIQLLLSTMEGQMAKLESASLDDDDKESMAKVHGIAELLKVQAKSLQQYWTDEEKKQVDQYHEAREKTWNELKTLLGLPDEKTN